MSNPNFFKNSFKFSKQKMQQHLLKFVVDCNNTSPETSGDTNGDHGVVVASTSHDHCDSNDQELITANSSTNIAINNNDDVVNNCDPDTGTKQTSGLDGVQNNESILPTTSKCQDLSSTIDDSELLSTIDEFDSSNLLSMADFTAEVEDGGLNVKKRLKLEDFLQQIVSLIDSSNDKIWLNLLLDFTKNFAEHQVPYDHFVTNHFDLLTEMLEIIFESLENSAVERRIFACQLLLNIIDLLNQDLIENKVMPVLKSSMEKEITTSVRFNLCFLLANFAKRLGFDYFVSTIFPYFEKLYTDCTTSLANVVTIGFATLDSMISLLPYLFQFNNVLYGPKSDQTEQAKAPESPNVFFSFIHEQYIPIIKRLFELLIDHINQYRKSPVPFDQESLECFLQWKDRTRSNESITQTLYLHYHNLCFFTLVLRDHLTIWNQEFANVITNDLWYLDFFNQLCHFLSIQPNDETLDFEMGHFNPVTVFSTDLNSPVGANMFLNTPMISTTNSSNLSTNLTSSIQTMSDEEPNSELNNQPSDYSQSFIGKFQLTETKVANRYFANNTANYSYSAINNLDIFGLFKFKSLSCKLSLTNSIPILTDLYYVTRKMENGKQFDSEVIVNRLIGNFDLIIRDSNCEIITKMVNIFEKICNFPNPLRFYSFIVNVLQTHNVETLTFLVKNFFAIFSSMILNSPLTDASQSAIETIIKAFVQCESFLSSKPKWRLYIQYLDVLAHITRLIPSNLIKKYIVPSLMNRFFTIRPIPCRQAVARCLLVIYIENFAQNDFQTLVVDQNYEKVTKKLDFNLFEWLDVNLRLSTKYQVRQIYIDVYAILLQLLGGSEVTSGGNHYLADLSTLCPALVTIDLSKAQEDLLKVEQFPSMFLSMAITKYRILNALTSLAANDRVCTIRASACTVVHSMIQFLQKTANCKECKYPTSHKLVSSYLGQYMNNSVNEENANSLLNRMSVETDRITFDELQRLYVLIDDVRLEYDAFDFEPLLAVEDEEQETEEDNANPDEDEPIPNEIMGLVDEMLTAVELYSLALIEDMQTDESGQPAELPEPNLEDVGKEEQSKTHAKPSTPYPGIIVISSEEISKSNAEAASESSNGKRSKKVKYSKCLLKSLSNSAPTSNAAAAALHANKTNKRSNSSSMIPSFLPAQRAKNPANNHNGPANPGWFRKPNSPPALYPQPHFANPANSKLPVIYKSSPNAISFRLHYPQQLHPMMFTPPPSGSANFYSNNQVFQRSSPLIGTKPSIPLLPSPSLHFHRVPSPTAVSSQFHSVTTHSTYGRNRGGHHGPRGPRLRPPGNKNSGTTNNNNSIHSKRKTNSGPKRTPGTRTPDSASGDEDGRNANCFLMEKCVISTNPTLDDDTLNANSDN